MARLETPRSQLAARLGMPILSERIVRDCSPVITIGFDCTGFRRFLEDSRRHFDAGLRGVLESTKLPPELLKGTGPLL